jgi:Flp pilus assembly protein TadG
MNTQIASSLFRGSSGRAAAAPRLSRLHRSRITQGQSAVEFALISVVVLMIMLVGVQYALIGQAALAVSQASAALGRYASNHVPPSAGSLGDATGNGTVSASSLPAAAQELLSQSILTNNGADLSVTVASYQGTSTKASTTNKRPPQFADTCVVTLSYTTTSKLALPNPFLGLITFPGSVSASDSQMYQ